MHQTFILVTQEAEKLGAKHRPIFFETPCMCVCLFVCVYVCVV